MQNMNMKCFLLFINPVSEYLYFNTQEGLTTETEKEEMDHNYWWRDSSEEVYNMALALWRHWLFSKPLWDLFFLLLSLPIIYLSSTYFCTSKSLETETQKKFMQYFYESSMHTKMRLSSLKGSLVAHCSGLETQDWAQTENDSDAKKPFIVQCSFCLSFMVLNSIKLSKSHIPSRG